MLKLQQLKKKQQEQQAAKEKEEAEKKDQGTGYVLKRQNSKELAEVRKQKSKESLLSLRSKARSGGGRTAPAELRAQKGRNPVIYQQTSQRWKFL